MKSLEYGFSLLEMIAVMAIASILAGTLAPGIIRTLDDANSAAETDSLSAIADAFTDYVLKNKRIPSSSPNDWGPALAEVASVSPTNIIKNQHNYSRAIYFDPRFFTSSESNFTGFTQSLGLNEKPVSPRLFIASDLSADLSTSQLTSTQFDAVWNQSNNASIVEGKTLKIKRVNLGSIFHHILFTNEHANSVAFSLENGVIGAIPPKIGPTDGQQNKYIIAATQLRLYVAPHPSGDLQKSLLVNASQSFSFADLGGSWAWR